MGANKFKHGQPIRIEWIAVDWLATAKGERSFAFCCSGSADWKAKTQSTSL
jgi:hypothetical protein